MFPPTYRPLFLSIIYVALSAVIIGQPHSDSVGRPAPGGPAPAASVVGKIVAQGATPAAAAGTRILLRRIDEAAPVTAEVAGADGSFVFYGLTPGEYSVEPDALTLPGKFRSSGPTVLRIIAGRRADVVLQLEARRSITGRVFIDSNGDGQFSQRNDTTIAGAAVSAGGVFAVTDKSGAFRLTDLPSGRTSILVSRSGDAHATHVVLDLAEGPVTDRIINIAISR
ncbi:MAG TPA: carboxypeptidase-like regulatory domain-containing protein [Pyrinomonadaceae bacterium]|jgi:hypothetical protein|nr:carboxypeptidase-like regulatory domain-containing protein [Pyrinomonadaceae bacterium]